MPCEFFASCVQEILPRQSGFLFTTSHKIRGEPRLRFCQTGDMMKIRARFVTDQVFGHGARRLWTVSAAKWPVSGGAKTSRCAETLKNP
jgi:hypothetical protein